MTVYKICVKDTMFQLNELISGRKIVIFLLFVYAFMVVKIKES